MGVCRRFGAHLYVSRAALNAQHGIQVGHGSRDARDEAAVVVEATETGAEGKLALECSLAISHMAKQKSATAELHSMSTALKNSNQLNTLNHKQRQSVTPVPEPASQVACHQALHGSECGVPTASTQSAAAGLRCTGRPCSSRTVPRPRTAAPARRQSPARPQLLQTAAWPLAAQTPAQGGQFSDTSAEDRGFVLALTVM